MAAREEGSAEERLIARYFRPLAKHPGALGLSDDAAILTPPPGCDLVLTTDGVIAGVHFFPDDPPDTIGRKALRMNLSDLAGKGAKPLGFLLSAALPADVEEKWLADFAAGLGADVFLATPLGTSALAFTVVGHLVGEVMGRRATGAGAAVCTPASPCFACRIRRSGAVRHPERSRPQGTRPERRRTERRRAAVRRAAVLTAAGVGGGRLALVLASTALGGVPFPGGGGLLRVAGVAIVSAPLGPPAFAAARRRPAAAHPNGGRRRLAAHPGAGRRRPAAADPGARRPAAAHPGTDRAGRRAPGAAA